MKTIYLCGPIAGCTFDGAVDWRNSVRETIEHDYAGVRCLSPMRDKDALRLGHEGPISGSGYARLDPLLSERTIFDRDRHDVFQSDLLLVHLREAPRVSIGSMVEMGWATAKGIPVVVVPDASYHDHLFVRQCASAICPDLPEAIRCAASFLALEAR